MKAHLCITSRPDEAQTQYLLAFKSYCTKWVASLADDLQKFRSSMVLNEFEEALQCAWGQTVDLCALGIPAFRQRGLSRSESEYLYDVLTTVRLTCCDTLLMFLKKPLMCKATKDDIAKLTSLRDQWSPAALSVADHDVAGPQLLRSQCSLLLALSSTPENHAQVNQLGFVQRVMSVLNGTRQGPPAGPNRHSMVEIIIVFFVAWVNLAVDGVQSKLPSPYTDQLCSTIGAAGFFDVVVDIIHEATKQDIPKSLLTVTVGAIKLFLTHSTKNLQRATTVTITTALTRLGEKCPAHYQLKEWQEHVVPIINHVLEDINVKQRASNSRPVAPPAPTASFKMHTAARTAAAAVRLVFYLIFFFFKQFDSFLSFLAKHRRCQRYPPRMVQHTTTVFRY